MIGVYYRPIESVITDERSIDKLNIQPADISRCYNIIKALSLKRYTLSDYVYSPTKYIDRNILGWISDDLISILPKTIKYVKHNCNERFTSLVNTLGDINNNLISYDVIPNLPTIQKDQIYANMYGALQKVIQDKEALEEKVAIQQQTIDALLTWAKSQGYQPSS